MALNIQAGARSLIQIGLSISDVSVLLQAARSFGNWLRVNANDEELFDTLAEDYGVCLRRKGLVDSTLMENYWSHQLHLIHQGAIIHDNAESRKEDDGQLGNFSWLMVAIVAAVDQCLESHDLRELLVELITRLLLRDDAHDVREALSIQIQTNIESWRSTGNVRGMTAPLCTATKECRLHLVGVATIPQLTRAEKRELLEFLEWLMTPGIDHYTLVSATVFSVAAALQCAKIQLSLGKVDPDIEGQVVIQYAEEQGGVQALLDGAGGGWDPWQTEKEQIEVPPMQVAYLSGQPAQIISAFPCSIPTKNQLHRFWERGAEAAKKVSLRAVARLKCTGIKYIVQDYDKCETLQGGRLMDLSSEHFPVDSESLLMALYDLMESLPEELQNWLYKSAKLDGGVNDLENHLTQDQMDAFLRYQCLVFGYWYELLNPWVSLDYIEQEVYFYGVWGYRDTYLLSRLRTTATSLRHSLTKLHDGLSREQMLYVLGTMFAGRSNHRSERPRKEKPILTHGMMAILDKISIVSMSLLKVSDEAQEQTRFAILSMPLINVVPDRDGELWTGDAKGIDFSTSVNGSQQVIRRKPREHWSVHPKMTAVGGRLSDVVMMARCGGVVVGIFNPRDADAALLRAQENRSGHLTQVSSGIGPPKRYLDVLEQNFQKGVVFRPTREGDVVVVHSQGSPIMRYAAAGFYAKESHTVIGYPDHQDAIRAIRAQMCGRFESCGYGIIID